MSRLKGFMLIEGIIMFSITSLLLLYGIRFAILISNQRNDYIDDKKLDYIADAMRSFAINKGYLPYPSSLEAHDGLSSLYAADETAWENNAFAYTYGYVPYITLGIPKEKTINSYGNPIIYIVNPTMGHRQNTEYVSPGHFALTVDCNSSKEYNIYVNEKEGIIDSIYVSKPEHVKEINNQSEYNAKEISMPTKNYASISCVRSHTTFGDNKGKVINWDLATEYESLEPKIQTYDGKIIPVEDICYNAYDVSIKGESVPIGEYPRLLGNKLYLLAKMEENKKENKGSETSEIKTRISNKMAFCIVSQKNNKKPINGSTFTLSRGDKYRFYSRARLLKHLFGNIYYLTCPSTP